MNHRLAILLFLAAFAAATPAPAATNLDSQNYRRAFNLINSGHVLEAGVFGIRGRDTALNKVIRGIYLGQPGNDAGFNELTAFITNNPEWPNIKGITAMTEQKMPEKATNELVLNWFAAHPPITLIGFYRYIDALSISGNNQNVTNLIRTRWIEGDFTSEELQVFHVRFTQYLGDDEIWARLDRLLWKGDSLAAKQMYTYVDPGTKALAEARLGLAKKAKNADSLIAHVPTDMQSDPGLIYERLRNYVRDNRDDQALTILQHPLEHLGKPEAWWEQRHIMARRLMETKNYESAYRLAIDHGQLQGRSLIDAEFLCGWLALRFLGAPEEAHRHFQILYDNANTPISRARGAYWLGRTYEAHGDKEIAEQAYETAAALNITYYGQLAATRIYDNPTINASPEPAIPENVRSAFYSRDLIRAIEHLHAMGEVDRAHIYFRAATDTAEQRSEFALLTELAYRLERPDYAVEAGKAANQKNMLMAAGGFPLLDHKLPKSSDMAFTHALIRQESLFNPKAKSPVGAMGLMQLMPATAKQVAKSLGLRYKAKNLSTPEYNIRLGSAFIKDQVNDFGGSYVLALAGYNAGPRRVRDWIGDIGDPRKPDVDVVDWIEEIPIPETRNYVQRIMESLQVYRARLAGGKAPLQIMRDLKR
jgi:soluble lytic murein transglycosylase